MAVSEHICSSWGPTAGWVCVPFQQRVLLGSMLSHHLFLLHLLCLFSSLPFPSLSWCVCVRVLFVWSCVSVCVCMKDHPEWSIRHCPKERWWKPGRIAQHSFKARAEMTNADDHQSRWWNRLVNMFLLRCGSIRKRLTTREELLFLGAGYAAF